MKVNTNLILHYSVNRDNVILEISVMKSWWFSLFPIYAHVPTQSTTIPLNWSFHEHPMKKKPDKVETPSPPSSKGMIGIILVSQAILHSERGPQSGYDKCFSFVACVDVPHVLSQEHRFQEKYPSYTAQKKQKLPWKKQRLYLALPELFRIARMHLIMSLPLSMSVTADKLDSSSWSIE